MQLVQVQRDKHGSLQVDGDTFPPKDASKMWAANYLIGWQDPMTPVVFPGCFPWLPPGFDIMNDPCPMIPDRAAICKVNRELHAKNGITHSFREFMPGQAMGKLAGKKVILLGSGPSLGTQRPALEKARAAGHPVVAVNGAIQAVPSADVCFILERCAKPEWWANVDPRRTVLWTSPSAHHSICERWPTERRFYFLHHWDVFDGWRDCPDIIKTLPATLSCMVSTINCLQLLAYCGVAEIWLLGQDFCGALTWAPNEHGAMGWKPGAYYWDGSFPTELHGEAATVRHDHRGNPVATTSRLWLMGLATQLSCELIALNAGIPVKNCSRTGMLELPACTEWEQYEH